MKLFQKKKTNNKGFSLVELIVVVAIMAVLLGVLVPTLVRHIESSKQSKDLDNIEAVRNAMEIALASESYSDMEGTVTYKGSDTFTIKRDTAIDGLDTTIAEDTRKGYSNEVLDNLATNEAQFDLKLTSKKYKAVTFTFKISNEHAKVTYTDADGKEVPVE